MKLLKYGEVWYFLTALVLCLIAYGLLTDCPGTAGVYQYCGE